MIGSVGKKEVFLDSCIPLKLKHGCSNVQTSRLQIEGDTLRVVPTLLAYLVWGIIFVSGVTPALMLLMVGGTFLPGLMIFLFFVTLGTCGIVLTFRKRRPEIDFRARLFYPAGRKQGRRYAEAIPLDEVVSVYLLEKLVSSGKNGSYMGYELNIRFRNGRCYNLLNHGNLEKIREDAEKLSAALKIPLEEIMDPHQSLQQKKNNAAALIIVGICFLLIGGIASYLGCIRPLWMYAESQSWSSVSAVIRESYVDSYRGSKGSTQYRLKLKYQYQWQGKKYTSDQYDYFMENSSNLRYYRSIVRKNPPGKTVVCYVNPSKPGQAVLNREFSLSALIPMLFVNLFPIVGAGLLVWGLKSRRRLQS